jgi:hypothetical protein
MPETYHDPWEAHRKREAEEDLMPVDQLHRAVTFSCLRVENDWDPIWSVARTFEVPTLDKNSRKYRISSHWYRLSDGRYELTGERLAYSAIFAPYVWQVRNAGLWALLKADRRLPAEQLISTIRRLPPRVVMRVLEDPDPVSGLVAPKMDLHIDDLRAVQKLGNFDALSALLALTDLYELFNDSFSARQAARIAGKLFLHISGYPPLGHLAIDAWVHLKHRYLDRLIPGDFDCYVKERNRLDTIVEVAIKTGIIGGRWKEETQLLFLADREWFPKLEKAAFRTLDDIMWGNKHCYAFDPPLHELANLYLREFSPAEDLSPHTSHPDRERENIEFLESVLAEAPPAKRKTITLARRSRVLP